MKESLYALLVLCLIIPLIIGVVYCLKRILSQSLVKNKKELVNILYQYSFGSKERLVCVEVNGVNILLGVTPHSISTLYTFTNQCSKDLA